MPDTIRERIDTIIRSLNSIDVRGEENLDILLGCILALKAVRDMPEKEAANGN